MATSKQIEDLRKGFKDIFDSHNKFKKDYVENLEAIAIKYLEDQAKTCDKCDNKHDGLYSMECFSCKRYNVDKWRAK